MKKIAYMLADALKAERPGANWDPNKAVQWELDVRAVINACIKADPRLKKDELLDYIYADRPRTAYSPS